MMDVEAGEMLPKLVAAVEMVLNPLTPHQQRLEAHQVSNSPIIVHRLGRLISVRSLSVAVASPVLQSVTKTVRLRY